MILPDNELVIFDLETTDIEESPNEAPEIIEVGALLVDRQLEVINKYSSLVYPEHLEKFTPFCEKLTGITKQELLLASKWKDVCLHFSKFTKFNAYRLAGWQVNFDFNVLKADCVRHNKLFPFRHSPVDIYSIYYSYCASNGLHLKSSSLKFVCDQLNITRPERHRALDDAVCTLEVLRKILAYNKESDWDGLIEVG